ncbi:MAG: FecR domain-containing protein [Proteobacteria bacterium]|nr:FecR domain-containing protein [Pseudomonadota bacterium]
MTAAALSRRALTLGSPLALLAAGAARAADPAGAVEAIQGQVTAQAGAAARTLAKDAPVFVGDTVATGAQSGVALRLGQATKVRLGEQAKLRIDAFLLKAGGVLDLAQGALLVEHDAASDQGEVAVRSPFGLIAVRGTRFFAGPSNGVFGVFVWEGEVMVVGRNTFVRVLPGYGTDVAKPGDEPTPTHQWAAQRIKEAERKLLV